LVSGRENAGSVTANVVNAGSVTVQQNLGLSILENGIIELNPLFDLANSSAELVRWANLVTATVTALLPAGSNLNTGDVIATIFDFFPPFDVTGTFVTTVGSPTPRAFRLMPDGNLVLSGSSIPAVTDAEVNFTVTWMLTD
jgi:hypothetical protein